MELIIKKELAQNIKFSNNGKKFPLLDCVNFVKWVFEQNGYNFRDIVKVNYAKDWANSKDENILLRSIVNFFDLNNLKIDKIFTNKKFTTGDLVFFLPRFRKQICHVGIYIKPYVVHVAPCRNIIYSTVNNPRFKKNYKFTIRLKNGNT